MLVDANILLLRGRRDLPPARRRPRLARDRAQPAAAGGTARQSLVAFVRIATHPRALTSPLAAGAAWAFVEDWLDAPVAWVPQPGPGHRAILRRLVCDLDLRGHLVSDAVLAALSVEHGLAVVSADSDFARFRELTWVNPVAG